MSDDLISRSALIRFIDVGQFRHPTELCYSELDVENLIKNAPAVDAVPVVHGRWIMKETMVRSPFAKNAYCSECFEETSYAYNYCPNCGAKMDGERKDNGNSN